MKVMYHTLKNKKKVKHKKHNNASILKNETKPLKGTNPKGKKHSLYRVMNSVCCVFIFIQLLNILISLVTSSLIHWLFKNYLISTIFEFSFLVLLIDF